MMALVVVSNTRHQASLGDYFVQFIIHFGLFFHVVNIILVVKPIGADFLVKVFPFNNILVVI